MSGGWLELTTWFGEQDRIDGRLKAEALLESFGRRGLAASVLLRGIGGFGHDHHLRTDRTLTLSEDLPVTAIALDRRDRIEAALDEAAGLRPRGLVTVQAARLAAGSPAPAGGPVPPGAPEPGDGPTGEGARPGDEARLTLCLGRKDRVGRRPAHLAVCDLLRAHGVAGVTALLGVDGTRDGARERARFFDRNADVPVMLVAVGAAASLEAALAEIGRLVDRPLATVRPVRIRKRDGVALPGPAEAAAGRPPPGPGREAWHRLTVYTSEAAAHEGQPIHRQIVRRLRESGAGGATALRGFWGYHGDHRPHGDRPLQLRRHVPVVTTVVDRPDRVAAAYPVIDELTRETGLVTLETVELVAAALPPGQSEP